MKKLLAICTIAVSITSGLTAVTDAQAKNQASDILSGMVSGHNLAFGKDNLYKETLDLGMWNKAISNMKVFTTNIMKETRNFLGMTSSTLSSALDKITKAEMDLVNAIKATRGIKGARGNVQPQITIFNRIKNDMSAVQRSLSSSTTPVSKDEARKLLKSTALFIETTAIKAAKDAQKP